MTSPYIEPCAPRCNSRRTASMTENDKASSRPTVADRSSSAAIAVDRLVKVYKQTRAVDDISFSLPRGSITGSFGPWMQLVAFMNTTGSFGIGTPDSAAWSA